MSLESKYLKQCSAFPAPITKRRAEHLQPTRASTRVKKPSAQAAEAKPARGAKPQPALANVTPEKRINPTAGHRTPFKQQRLESPTTATVARLRKTLAARGSTAIEEESKSN